MPLNYTPTRSRGYLPKAGAYQSAWNARSNAIFGSNTRTLGTQPQFNAPTGTFFAEGGRAGIQGGDLLSDLIRAPAHMLESPLRIPNVVTGGGVGEALKTAVDIGRNIPVIGTAISAAEIGVGLLQWENKGVRAAMNQGIAVALRESIGKSPNDMMNTWQWGEITVGEFRKKIQRMWATNDYTGEQMTLAMLEQKAAQGDDFGFGEFRTDENGIVGFAREMVASPSSYLLGTGLISRGLRAVPGAASLAGWARAVPAGMGRFAYLPTTGRGALTAIRGEGWVAKPEFLAVREFLNSPPGRLGSLTLTGLLRAGQKLYFPGYTALRLPRATQLGERLTEYTLAGGRTGAGLGRVQAGFVAYQRGGLQQMAVLSGAEHALNAIGERQYDENGGPISPANGFADTIHDLLHAINNDHPMSDNGTFTMLALFSPWPHAVGSAWKGIRNRRINPAAYYDDAIVGLRNHLEQETGFKYKNNDEFLLDLGRGDMEKGRAIWEYFVEYGDVRLVENQLSGFSNSVVSTIEGKLHRANFIEPLVVSAVLRRRQSGALRPRSNAEFLVRLYREGEGSDPAIRLAQQHRTITTRGFVDSLWDKYHADIDMMSRLEPTRNLIAREGRIVTQEQMKGIRAMLDQFDDNEIIPRDVAALIIERNPWLMHQTEFWNEFAITLGQRLEKTGLTKGRSALPQGTEGITIRELKERIDDFIPELTTEQELFHELEAAQRQVLEMGQVQKVITAEVPEAMPARMQAFRERFVTASSHALDLKNKILRIRNQEFNRNGSPKFQSAQTLRGHFNGLFTRVGKSNTFRKEAPPINLSRVTVVSRLWDQYSPNPRNRAQMEFIGNDLDRHYLPAEQAYEGVVGDREVYIFQPVREQHTIKIGNSPSSTTVTSPQIYKVIPKYGDRPELVSLNPDLWYVARKDGNGTLMDNHGFTSKERAARAMHRHTLQQVTVSIDDGVITIEGKLPVREPNPVADTQGARYLEADEAQILLDERGRWQAAGRTEPVGSIVRESGPLSPPMLNGSRLQTETFRVIGDDGLPVGQTRIDMRDGNAESVTIYVDPTYRGNGLAEAMYDEAFREGIDLSNISGINNTEAGRRFTDTYWANRRDTLDTEALQLAVENGGRIIEMPVHQPLMRSGEIRDIMDPLSTTDALEAINILELEGADMGGLRELLDEGRLGVTSYRYGDREVISIMNYEAGWQTDLYYLEGPLGELPTLVKTDIDVGVYRDSHIESYLNIEPTTVIEGGQRHSETLSRWGFHEVARYGDPLPAPQLFRNHDPRFADSIFDEAGNNYRIDKIESLNRIRKSGLKGGLPRINEKYGVYFADSAGTAENLVPPRIGQDSMIIRIKNGNYETGAYPGEVIYDRPIPVDQIEFYGNDGNWHSMADRGEMAVYAYRGGDTTQAIMNSRIEGANPAYRPSDRRVNSRNAALNLARKRANDASVLYPTLDTLGQGYSNSRRFFSPEERRLHLNELSDNLGAQAKSGAESIQWFDDTVETVVGLKKVTGLDQWFERALPEEINSMVDTVKRLNEDWPGLQLVEGGSVVMDPRAERFGHLLTTHSILQRMSYDYGFLSPFTRFFDIFEPHSSVYLAQEARRELETQMSAVGLTAKQTERFYDGMRETIVRSRSAEGIGSMIGSYKYRNARAIEEGELRGILRDAAGQAGLDAVLGRYASVHRMITESSAGLLRRSARRARAGGKVGWVEAAMNTFARSWQYDPQLRGLSGITHTLSKFYYPLIRFRTDPLFAGMNLLEPYMYGISRNGIANGLRKRSRYQQMMNERVFRESQRSSIPAGGLADVEHLPIEILLQDSGMFTLPVNMKNPLLGDFEVTRLDQLTQYLKDIPETDPLARLFQERFGKMSGDNWARGMEDVMFGFMDESIEGITRTQFKEYFDELGFTQSELEMMAPFVNTVAERYRGLADDVVDLYVGRMRRSTVERVMDNFWLFWPTSYIVKATTWLANIMTKRVGGMDVGAGGAYLYTQYRDRFLKALENDKDMQAWMEENRDFLFLFEMMFPITPESIGISLNPATRIAASWVNANTVNAPEIQRLFGDYSYIESIPEAVERTVRFGPVRTWLLFRRLMNSMEVPGWTYGEGGGASVPSTVSRASRLPSFGGLATSVSEEALAP